VEGDWQEADFLLLAAGARNQLLPETRALQRDELEMTQGYFVPQNSDPSHQVPAQLKAISGRIPRLRSSVGRHLREHVVAYQHGTAQPSANLRGETRYTDGGRKVFIATSYLAEGAHAFRKNVIGKNWALVGDALPG